MSGLIVTAIVSSFILIAIAFIFIELLSFFLQGGGK